MLWSSINQSLMKGAGVKKVENSLSSAKYNPRLYRDSVHNGLSGLAKPKGSAGYVHVCVCVRQVQLWVSRGLMLMILLARNQYVHKME